MEDGLHIHCILKSQRLCPMALVVSSLNQGNMAKEWQPDNDLSSAIGCNGKTKRPHVPFEAVGLVGLIVISMRMQNPSVSGPAAGHHTADTAKHPCFNVLL